MKKEKLDAFTDAVVAILITLMVLEIKLPQVTIQNLMDVLRHIGIYAMSFVVIGITWLNYNTFFKYLNHLSTKTIWLNLIFLFFLSLIPLPTQALGENFYKKESHIFYGIILTLVSVVYTLMQYTANPSIAALTKAELARLNKKNWLAVVLYALSIPLSLVHIYLSTTIFILLPVLYFLPSKKLLAAGDK
jgi:uncharacterized membrane protein